MVAEDIKSDETIQDIYETLQSAGAFAALWTIGMLPRINFLDFNYIPVELARMLMAVFSVPILVVFLIEVIFNQEVDIKKNVPFLILLSFVVFLLIEGPAKAMLFPIGMGISFMVLFIFKFFHKISPFIEKLIPGRQEKTKRFLFFSAYLPTVIISVIVLTFLSEWIFLPFGG